MRNKLRLVIWFGGIGADCRAFERAKIEHHIVDCVELDKHAVKAFNLLNGTSFEPKDINDVNVNGYGEVDILVAGWPCQDLTTTGKQAGLVEGKRSSLIGTTIKKIGDMEHKPKVILLENVKGLLHKKHAQDFEVIKGAFKALGYHGSHKLLNSKYFGVPQARERVYCVLKRDKPFTWEGAEKFNKVEVKLKDILDKEVEGERTTDGIGYYNFINTGRNKRGELVNYNFNRYGKDTGVSGTLNTFCLTGVSKEDNGKRYFRKLTPRECGKLMGFTTDEFNKVEGEISNSQLCKQAGNSIVVNVLVEIFKELYKTRRENMNKKEIGIGHMLINRSKNDECYTPVEAVMMIKEQLEKFKGKIIGLPFDLECSLYYILLKEWGHNVVISHVETGQDFYDYEPEKGDVLLSNPPFTDKRKIVKRCISFKKPFALLLPQTYLGDKKPVEDLIEAEITLQEFIPNKRIKFIDRYTGKPFVNKEGKTQTPTFKTIYYGGKFFDKEITYGII